MALDYALSYNGFSFGAGTNVAILQADGLEDLPGIRVFDMPRGGFDGEVPGFDLADGRVITMDLLVLDSGAGDFPATVEAAKAAFIQSTTESALTFQLPGNRLRTMNVRCRRRAIPVTTEYAYRFAKLTVEFHATDPRIYDQVALQSTAPPFAAGTAGFTLRLGSGVNAGFVLRTGSGANAGFVYSGTVGSGAVNCINSGNVATYPTFTIKSGSGISAWTITNTTTGVIATFAGTMGPGSVMTFNLQAVTNGSSTVIPVSVDGASRYTFWQSPRSILSLQPGLNVLQFDVQAGDAVNSSCQVAWSNAYL